MARFKDFGNPEDSKAENLTFRLHGEEFSCYPAMPGKVLLEFIQKTSSENGGDSAAAVNMFFQKVLLPESYERFDKLAQDPDRIVSMSTLADIVSWVMEEYSDRPSEGSEHSQSGE